MADMIFLPVGKETWLSRLNPMVKLLYGAFISIMISTGSDLEIAVLSVLLVIISYSASIPLISRLIHTPSILIIALLILITDAINGQDGWGTLSFLSLFSIAVIFIGSTDMMDFSASLGSALSHIIGRKAYGFASDVIITMSMLPDIFIVSSEMLTARRVRGGSFRSHPIKNLSEYTVSFMILMIRRASELSDALDARSYERNAKRLSPPYRRSDVLLLIILIVSGGIALWIRLH